MVLRRRTRNPLLFLLWAEKKMIQKLINVVALLSGLTSLALIGSGVHGYMNREAYQEQARERLAELISDAISDVVLPDVTTGPMGPGMRLP